MGVNQRQESRMFKKASERLQPYNSTSINSSVGLFYQGVSSKVSSRDYYYYYCTLLCAPFRVFFILASNIGWHFEH